MNIPPRKLKSDQQHEQVTGSESVAEQRKFVDFGSVEELLRHDALHTPVPPRVAERLRISLGEEHESHARPWWKRLFG